MSEPRHSPPPSAHAPKPKGILKNPLDRRPSQAEGDALSGGAAPIASDKGTSDVGATGPHSTFSNGLSWDEQNIALHDFEKENTQRMKIDEPKTPFVRGAGMDEDGFDAFNLDTASPAQTSTSYFGEGSSSSPTSGSADAQLTANTTANAGAGTDRRGSSSGAQGGVGLAVGLDAADLKASGSQSASSSNMTVPNMSDGGDGKRTQSRSPSFSLPSSGGSSRRASSRSAVAGDDSRSGVRQQNADQAMDIDGQDEAARNEAVSEEEDEETRAQKEAFARKRNAHYGQEALIAKALASKGVDDEDEEDEDEEDRGPGAAAVVNGT